MLLISNISLFDIISNMKLYNTLTLKIEEFKPLNPSYVTLYTCGPTVYDYPHIGNMRTFVTYDILKRTLNYFEYKVKHVMNITDVGHLTGDDDTGEDKLEKGAKREKKSVLEIAKSYTNIFFKYMEELNISPPDITCKATEYISQMIELVKVLEQKGYTYETKNAVYFDISKFKNYGKLSKQNLKDKIKGARQEVYIDENKKNPADFALWMKTVGRFKMHELFWNSPWGKGFPGWHIECSAMALKHLGNTIDIHAGGVEHIPVHHENEIAQSESATGKPFVRYFIHCEHLHVYGKKMSKSLGNFFTLDDVINKGIEPLALRLLYLQTHYRQQMNFTWESAKAAQEAYSNLKEIILSLKKAALHNSMLSQESLIKIDKYNLEFDNSISNDLQLPKAIAVMWNMIKSDISAQDKLELLLKFDQVLGLKLNEVKDYKISDKIKSLLKEREQARKDGDYDKSDEIRRKIKEMGFEIKDKPQGFEIKKI